MKRFRTLPVLLVIAALVVASCGDDDTGDETNDDAAPATTEAESTSTTEETTTTAAPEPIQILVTNDDGIGAPGIDALVTALSALDAVEITIVAPAENQSGSSDKTTPGGVTSSPGATAGGVEGTAVAGFPADSVLVALDEQGLEPDLVVSGVNEGQNVGPFAELSGTLGAARTALRRGIPAVAASAGLGENADFPAAAAFVVDWVETNRDAIADGSIGADEVVSYNVPGCTAGEIGDLVEVSVAAAIPEGLNVFETDCSLEPPATAPTDDVSAISQGYASVSRVPADL